MLGHMSALGVHLVCVRPPPPPPPPPHPPTPLQGDPTHRLSPADSLFTATERREGDDVRKSEGEEEEEERAGGVVERKRSQRQTTGMK